MVSDCLLPVMSRSISMACLGLKLFRSSIRLQSALPRSATYMISAVITSSTRHSTLYLYVFGQQRPEYNLIGWSYRYWCVYSSRQAFLFRTPVKAHYLDAIAERRSHQDSELIAERRSNQDSEPSHASGRGRVTNFVLKGASVSFGVTFHRYPANYFEVAYSSIQHECNC